MADQAPSQAFSFAAPQGVKGASRANALMTGLFVLAALIALFPVLSVAVPPLPDYPNHYARLWLISGGVEDPAFSAVYRVDWGVAWTNVLIDMIAGLIGPFLPITVLSPILLAIGLLMPAIGIAALNGTLFGGLHWWAVFCMMLVWNFIFLAGFINFEIGLGLALLFAAGDIRLAAKPALSRMAYRIAASALLLLAHPFALMFFALLQAALAFGPRISLFLRPREWPAMIGRMLAFCLPCFVPLAALMLFGPALPGSDGPAGRAGLVWGEWSLSNAASVLLTYFKTYDPRPDAIYLALFVAVLGMAYLRRRLAVHWGLVLVAGLLALASPFMPVAYLGTGAMDLRLPSMMVLALAAGLRPEIFEGRRTIMAVSAFALAVVASRTILVDRVWRAGERNIDAVEAALASVPAGSTVLPMQHTNDRALDPVAPAGRFLGRHMPIHWHYGSLAVVRQKAFIPTLFTAAGKQPLTILPPYTEISVPEGIPPTVDLLAKPVERDFPYMADWPHRFDYILVVNADMPNVAGPMPELANLTLVADEGFAQLYKVVK
ncbi:hypothetical protein BJF93_06665 [Xaviernesmea oryzae]|uniref:Transmembrane protein n=1 Tax=Xaviernesmea oryzae TaxID=464029 RepID=A0A1Q9ASA2_9HYPH|nr:hypothetical protein [Xaviernesmea oryzae]OLP58290.1 hypothetical protein BJF93_06665 [Xaviernesmea oryzae]SEL43226.1 hypothetical protein SAMN04487976_10879 [Xaviernesmea oryzae]